MDNTKKGNTRYFMILLVMCAFSCCSYGIAVNSAGVFFTPIAEEFNTGKGAVSLTLTLSSLLCALSGLGLPKILNEHSLKAVFGGAAACMVLSTIGMGLSPNIYFLYLMNALRGIGAGFVSYVTITIFVNNWFYAKHGLATSITMGFAGISGAILSPLFTSIIAQMGWRSAYNLSAVLLAVLLVPSIFLPISIKPETCGMHAYGIEQKKTVASADQNESSSAPAPFAYLLVCLVAVCSNVIIGLVQHLPSYALSVQLSAGTGAAMLSLALIGNIVSKLAGGALADLIGTRSSLLILACLHALSVVLLFFTGNLFFLYAGALLMGCGYGMGAVGISLMTKSLFGVEGFVHVFPVVSFIATIAYAIATAAIGYLYDITGGYQISFAICLVLAVLDIACILIAYRRHK
jgi:MFS family permease